MGWFSGNGGRLGFGLLILCCGMVGRVAGTERPNVILIYCDDLGWGDLGCYGHEKFKTPNIDRLAEEGARLTNFTSSCPYCAPSRAALQTGRYQFRTGLVDNPSPDPQHDDLGLSEKEVTLGDMFKSAGYDTSCVGKWHLGHQPRFFPTERGYDQYFGILYSNDMVPVTLYRNTNMVQTLVFQPTLTKRYTETALDFIDHHKTEPFFLYLAHAMPHKPLAASADFYQKEGDRGLYGDVMAELDWSVGQILSKLTELELDKKTVVFFSSDNGPWYGGSTGGLRGMKGQTWEGGLRVPLLARWPGKIPEGHVNEQPASIVDLFTTILGVAGIPLPKDRVIDGKDLLPMLTTDAPSPHEAIFSFQGEHLCTVRSGRWKLHTSFSGPRDQKPVVKGEPYHDPRGPDGIKILAPKEQYRPSDFPGVIGGYSGKGLALFDLEADPAEQTNVAASEPAVVERLLGYALKIQLEMPAWAGKKLAVEANLKQDQAIADLDHLGAKLDMTPAGLVSEIDLRGVQDLRDALKTVRVIQDVYRLVLPETKVTNAEFQQLEGWSGPRTLDLSHTNLGDAGLAPLAGFTKLEELNLRKTKVSDVGLVVLENLPELVILDLSQNSIGDAGLASLASLTKLMRLNLSRTNIDSDGLAHLKSMTHLESLNLHGTPVSGGGLAQLKKLTHLQTLDLSETSVGDTGLENLAALTRLQALSLAGTKLTDAGLANLKMARSLNKLNLSATGITDAGLPSLKLLSRLLQLSVERTATTDAGQTELNTMLPKMRILPAADLTPLDPKPSS